LLISISVYSLYVFSGIRVGAYSRKVGKRLYYSQPPLMIIWIPLLSPARRWSFERKIEGEN
jgi:hypothetical protein